VNLYNLDEFGPDDNFANTTSITARFMLNKFQPFISLGTPLDNSRDSIPFFLSGGIVVAP
jgi:hypothetical protein